MAWVSEASGISNTFGVTCTITVPAGGYATGHFLVLGIMIPNSTIPDMTVSDPGSNTWTTDQSIGVGTSGSAYQISCVVTSALSSGDTITITSSQGIARFACVLEEFDDTVIGPDVGATGNNGGSTSASPTTSTTAATSQDLELLVGTLGVASPMRVYTPGAGFTVGSYIVSTNGSGDRAVVIQWKYLSSIGTQVSDGSLDVGALYCALVESYKMTLPTIAWLTA
jgi:hypothetical protein